jgi:hypothetical protein
MSIPPILSETLSLFGLKLILSNLSHHAIFISGYKLDLIEPSSLLAVIVKKFYGLNENAESTLTVRSTSNCSPLSRRNIAAPSEFINLSNLIETLILMSAVSKNQKNVHFGQSELIHLLGKVIGKEKL